MSQRFLREKPISSRTHHAGARALAASAGGIAACCLAVCCLAGCGAAQPKQAGDENNFDATPSGPSGPSGSSSPGGEATPKWSAKSSAKGDDLTPENKQQMEDSLRRGGSKAAQCASVVPDAARGEGEVLVTFDGTKGRITDAKVGAPWAGTAAESCIQRAFVGEYSLRFDGSLEVPYTVKLGPKAGPPDKGSKKK